MSDPLVSAVAHHWGLVIGFAVSVAIIIRGWIEMFLGPRNMRGAIYAILGIVGFIDCLFLAFP